MFSIPSSHPVRLWFDSPDIPFIRALTFFMSTRTGPSIMTPKSGPRRAIWAARALATRVLVGIQPTLTQVPPISLRSITAVFNPSAFNRPARDGPA